MAENFPILFTGKDVSYEPRTTGELKAAGQRFDERLLAGRRHKVEERRRDEKFFFETADIDPVQIMSDKITQGQESLLNDFNDKWAGKYSAQGGNLTPAQKSEMFRDRKAMETKQAQWLASQSRLDRDWEIMKRDRQRINSMLDDDHFTEQVEMFNETGHYEGGLQYKPLNPGVYFTKNPLPGTGDREMTERREGGQIITTETRTRGTKEESDRFIENHIKQDMKGKGTLTMGILEEFLDQPPEEKAKYLMGGQIEGEVDTPQEANAIIRWAQDYYRKDVLREAVSTKDRDEPPKSSGSGSSKPPAGVLTEEGIIHDRNGNELMRQSDGISPSVIEGGQGYVFSDRVRTINVDAGVLYGPGGKSFTEVYGVPKQKLRLRPDVMTSGEVEFILVSPVKVEKKVPEAELTPKIINERNIKDGEYYTTITIPAGTAVGASLSGVEKDLANALEGDALKSAVEGLEEVDPYAKYKE